MKRALAFASIAATLLAGVPTSAHDTGLPHSESGPQQATATLIPLMEVLAAQKGPALANRQKLQATIAENLLRMDSSRRTGPATPPAWFQTASTGKASARTASAQSVFQPPLRRMRRSSLLPASALNPAASFGNALFSGIFVSLSPSLIAPAGNGALMAASFAPFKPRVRYYWDSTTFYAESDNMPDSTLMPNKMVGITSWQQQIPLPASYLASTTNPEKDSASLGYGQPNYWRLPLVPTPSASPIPISSGNFQRGAVAIAANGVAIFNPKNNTGRVSYEIGELDTYGGHCGLADDYHYHIIPTHLLSAFGGVLSNDKPVAWSLDGYPIYGYLEPDGTARQPLDADGGHDIGNGWGYHYHAIGTTTVDGTHPYGTPQSPYLMNNFHGTVVNYGGQVDGQPEVGSIRASGTGGYTAQPVAGASIIAFKNPVALSTDGSGNLVENPGGTPSPDQYLMRVSISGSSYDECWRINRNVNPKTVTVTWRLPAATTTTTYSSVNNRLTAYPMAAWSETKLPDTGQTLDATAIFGEDSDYTINPPSFLDNGDGTITDNVTGLMWQKVDAGESTWANAVTNGSAQTTGGYTDWRLPTPAELFSILNHNYNPALDLTKFPSNPNGAADYWWTSDIYGADATHVWCANAGGGLGPKPLTETISAGGSLRYHTRYVRGGKQNNGHNYINNNDGTITDADTGLMWTQLPAAPMNWNAALTYAENLTLAGYSDWRLPNVKELQTLTDYTLATATSTSGIKPCVNRTLFAKTLTRCSTVAGGTTITCDDTTGLLPGMVLVDTVDAGGAYLPLATPPVVAAVTSTTTFTVTNGTGIAAGSGLTFRALVPPTAYWTSSSVKAGTLTQAWLVEMGINNSVPPANGPTRNSQGIISYEVYASTYPVFAVRTTTVATQIAVEQPAGTPLVDGVSAVSYGNVNVGATATKSFVIRNNGTTSLTITGVSIDGTAAASFFVTSSPAPSIPAGGSTTLGVQFSAATSGTKVAALHIASSDTAVGTAFDVILSGTGYIPPPTISSAQTWPNTPTYVDGVAVTAALGASSGATISSAQLVFNNGAQTTATVFAETMSSTPTSGTNGWDGTGAVYAWTVTAAVGNVKQTTAANYGPGGTCGLDMNKGSSNPAGTMAQTTNATNTSGTAGYIEFWVATSNLTSGLGWNFQTSADNLNWTTRLSEGSGTNHAFQLYHYDLTVAERVPMLWIRFQFIGNGTGGPTAPRVQFDDITIVTTSGVPPVTLTMYDDGLHGDGLAGDGIFGAGIPVQSAGTTVTYSISVTDSNGSTTTLSPVNYVVSAVTPPSSFAATIVRAGGNAVISWPAQSSINYSVQWTDDLVHWANVPVGQVNTWTDATASGAPRRFYRVWR